MIKQNAKATKPNISLDIKIDEILTQRTCAHIIIEIVKFIALQKLQIPFTYEILKYLVDKKKLIDKNNPNINESYQSQKYFKTLSSALDNFELIFQNIIKELECNDPPSEIAILLGGSPSCAKEVYRIILPTTPNNHFFKNHSDKSKNLVTKTLRILSSCDELHTYVFKPIPLTNMYVILNRNTSESAPSLVQRTFSDFFLPVDSLRISPSVPQVILNLVYPPNVGTNCSSGMKIFDEFLPKMECVKSSDGDSETCDTKTDISDLGKNLTNLNINPTVSYSVSENIVDFKSEGWFRANVFHKGFKDCCVNGKSICDMWNLKS